MPNAAFKSVVAIGAGDTSEKVLIELRKDAVLPTSSVTLVAARYIALRATCSMASAHCLHCIRYLLCFLSSSSVTKTSVIFLLLRLHIVSSHHHHLLVYCIPSKSRLPFTIQPPKTKTLHGFSRDHLRFIRGQRYAPSSEVRGSSTTTNSSSVRSQHSHGWGKRRRILGLWHAAPPATMGCWFHMAGIRGLWEEKGTSTSISARLCS